MHLKEAARGVRLEPGDVALLRTGWGALWNDAGRRFTIEKGKIEGNQITFEFTAPEGDEDSTLVHRVKLTVVSETKLEGEIQFEAEGAKVSGKLTLARDK